MPRNPGTGIYTLPSGTAGTPNTPIESAKYNTFTGDIAQDLNTPRPVSSGGTGVTSIAAFKTAFNLTIGTDVQAYDAGLQSIAGLTTAADRLIYTTALDTYAVTTFTAFARTLLDDPDAVTMRTTIGAHDASNLSAGTVADARLPTSMAGKTFTSDVTVGSGSTFVIVKTDGGIEISRAAGTAHIDFKNASGDDFDVRISQNGTTGSLDITTTGGGLLRINGTRVIVNDGTTNDISITGNAASATLATKASTLSQNGGNGSAMTFNWSGQAGQPSWLWGSNDGVNHYVYDPSNFAVNNAQNLGGVAAANWLQTANLPAAMNAVAYNAVGAIAMMRRTAGGTVDQGTNSAGSNLVYSNADGSYTSAAATGTWECLGRASGASGAAAVACWRRIA